MNDISDRNKYIRPFNTKEELLKHFGYKSLSEKDRKHIKNMDDAKFKAYLEEATFGDCFDVGYFSYIIYNK